MKATRRWLTLGAVAAFAACASDGAGPSALDQLEADVALVAAEMAAQDIEFMGGPGGRFGFGFPPLGPHFDCGTVQRAALPVTITRTCTYLDENGDEQDAYDAVTTASVVLHVEVTGSMDHGEFSADMSRVRDLTVTGLAGAETSMTWNGTGSGTMTRVRPARDGGETQFDLEESETITDLVLPVPRSADGWPLGGTITQHVRVTITGGPRDGATHERDVVITFDGTQYATVTVNGETFTVDLANRRHRDRPGRPFRRGRGPGPGY